MIDRIVLLVLQGLDRRYPGQCFSKDEAFCRALERYLAGQYDADAGMFHEQDASLLADMTLSGFAGYSAEMAREYVLYYEARSTLDKISRTARAHAGERLSAGKYLPREEAALLERSAYSVATGLLRSELDHPRCEITLSETILDLRYAAGQIDEMSLRTGE